MPRRRRWARPRRPERVAAALWECRRLAANAPLQCGNLLSKTQPVPGITARTRERNPGQRVARSGQCLKRLTDPRGYCVLAARDAASHFFENPCELNVPLQRVKRQSFDPHGAACDGRSAEEITCCRCIRFDMVIAANVALRGLHPVFVTLLSQDAINANAK